MSKVFERLWVSLWDSNGVRQFARRGVGAVIFQSQAYRKLKLARHYVTSYYKSRQAPALFQGVETFCVFIGHNKSGNSMLSALLDAHPQIVLADEADVLQYVPAGFTRDQIYHVLLHRARREAMKGRVTAHRMTPYSFQVPGQWQGRYTTVRVVGDSTTGTATRRFARDPNLLRQLQNVMTGTAVKFVQVIRNPYDPISYMMVRGKRTFENAIAHYFENCETVRDMRKQVDSSSLFAVRYEDFVYQPGVRLAELCRFLGVEAAEDYLQACVSILRQTPDQHRQMVQWDAKWIGVVKDKMERFDFLAGYSFER